MDRNVKNPFRARVMLCRATSSAWRRVAACTSRPRDRHRAVPLGQTFYVFIPAVNNQVTLCCSNIERCSLTCNYRLRPRAPGPAMVQCVSRSSEFNGFVNVQRRPVQRLLPYRSHHHHHHYYAPFASEEAALLGRIECVRCGLLRSMIPGSGVTWNSGAPGQKCKDSPPRVPSPFHSLLTSPSLCNKLKN